MNSNSYLYVLIVFQLTIYIHISFHPNVTTTRQTPKQVLLVQENKLCDLSPGWSSFTFHASTASARQSVYMDPWKFWYKLHWCLHGSLQIFDQSQHLNLFLPSDGLCCDWLSLMFCLFRNLYMLTKKFKRVSCLNRWRSETIAICSNVYCKSPVNPAKIAMHAAAPSPPHICNLLLCVSFCLNVTQCIKIEAKCSKMLSFLAKHN